MLTLATMPSGHHADLQMPRFIHSLLLSEVCIVPAPLVFDSLLLLVSHTLIVAIATRATLTPVGGHLTSLLPITADCALAQLSEWSLLK